jgi:tetratricopeptide (TPR) repeat protein
MLANNNSHPAALLTTALAHLQGGRLREAEAAYRQALALAPDHANAHYNLALTLKAQGRLDEAAQAYRHTLRVRPDNAKAHNNLGVILEAIGQDDEAAGHYARAVAIQPGHANAHYNLANILRRREAFPQAIHHYREALLGKPDDPEAHNNLGIALAADGRPDEAIVHYRQALALKPDYAQAASNLGSALEDRGHVPAAIDCYRKALALMPDYADARYNLGHALQQEDRLDEAAAEYERALALDPTHAKAHNNFGFVMQLLGRVDEALARYIRARTLKPDYADAQWNEALALLLLGDFQAGWPKYEWRWRRKETPPRILATPAWDGGDLTGRTILLHAEQGRGDAIQFIRYAPLVKARGGIVIAECPESLIRLFGSAKGINRLIAVGDALPPFDCHASLLSLPGLLGTTLETTPANIPYLTAEPEKIDDWRRRLADDGRRKIGLVWRGNPQHANDCRRSIPAAAMAALPRDVDAEWVSLQIDASPDELAAFAPVALRNAAQGLADWADTAALIQALDLVVTVDTAVAHLAGALGKPVWVLLPFAPDWRWMQGRADSPWYPTMRLFRQPAPGGWAPVLADIGEALNGRERPMQTVRPKPRRMPAAMVVSHERSGTHFLMNALSHAYGYTAQPWIDLDEHAIVIDYSNPARIAEALEVKAADWLYGIVKSHHAVDFLRPELPRITESVLIFYVYRDPAATMVSLWRHLNGLSWDEGPRTADPLALARAAPAGRLTRYQAKPSTTMLLRWAAHVEGWLAAAAVNSRIVPVRYEDLESHYEPTVTSLAAIVGRAPLTPLSRPSRDVNVIDMAKSAEALPAYPAMWDALNAYCQAEIGPLLASLGA